MRSCFRYQWNRHFQPLSTLRPSVYYVSEASFLCTSFHSKASNSPRDFSPIAHSQHYHDVNGPSPAVQTAKGSRRRRRGSETFHNSSKHSSPGELLALLGNLEEQVRKRSFHGQNQSPIDFDDHLTFALKDHFGKLTSMSVNLILMGLKNADMALAFFHWSREQPNFKLDVRHFTTLVGVLGRERRFEEVENIMQVMKRDGLAPNLRFYTGAITAYIKANQLPSALSIFQRMRREKLMLDSHAYSVLIGMFSKMKDFDSATNLHREAQRLGITLDPLLSTTLISMYTSAGNITAAEEIFESMKSARFTESCSNQSGKASFTSTNRPFLRFQAYNTMIQSYITHSNISEAVNTFKKMCEEGVVPDDSILRAMSYVYLEQGSEGQKHSNHHCQPMNSAESESKVKEFMDDVSKAGVTLDAVWIGGWIERLLDANQTERAEDVYRVIYHAEGMQPNARTHELMIRVFLDQGKFGKARMYLDNMMELGHSMGLTLYTHLLRAFVNGSNSQMERMEAWKMMNESNLHIHDLLSMVMRNEIEDHVRGQAWALSLSRTIMKEEHEEGTRDDFVNACIDFLALHELDNYAGMVWRECRDRGACSSTLQSGKEESFVIDLHDKSPRAGMVVLRVELLRLRNLADKDFGQSLPRSLRVVVQSQAEASSADQRHSKSVPKSDPELEKTVHDFFRRMYSPFRMESDKRDSFLAHRSEFKPWLMNEDVYYDLRLRNGEKIPLP